MQLRNQVEWALHCAALLSHLPEGRYLSTKALAEFHGVPKEYLSKALQALSQAGIVTGTLGPAGGYRLAKPTDQITFLDIVEATEGKARTFKCTEIRRNNPCASPTHCYDKPCAVSKVMWEADEAWRDKLRSVRLSDLVSNLMRDLDPATAERGARWFMQHI